MVAPFTLDSLRGPPPRPLRPRTRARPALRARRTARRHRRRRRRGAGPAPRAGSCSSPRPGVFVGVRLRAPDPAPAVTPVADRTVARAPPCRSRCPGRPRGRRRSPSPPSASTMASGPEQPVPVASLTKLMTAYVVLHDHPLALNEPGPTITVTQADVDDYDHDTVEDDSNAHVDAQRADHGGAGARWPVGPLGRQLRRPHRPLGCGEHPRLRGEDERRRGGASAWPTRTSPTPAGSIRVPCRPPRISSRWRRPTWPIPRSRSMVKMPSITLPVAGTISTYTPFLGLLRDHRREVRLHHRSRRV